MEVSLGAVRAGELSIRVLLGDLVLSLRGSSSGRSRPAWGARQDPSPALRTDDMRRRVALWHLGHQRALAIRRVHSGLGHDTTSRHRAEHRRGTVTSRGRSGGNRLGMRSCRSGLRHHTRRNAGVRLLLVRVVAHDGVGIGTARILRRRGRVARHRARGAWGVWGRWSPGRVRIAPVRALLHNRVAWLERWQRVGRGRRLSLVVVGVVGVMRVLLRGQVR
jgi:hypothetical protein